MSDLTMTQAELEMKIKEATDEAVAKATQGLVAKKEELERKISKRNQELADAEEAKKKELEAAEQKKLEDEGKLNELVERLRTQLDEQKTEFETKLTEANDKLKKTDGSLRELIVDQELSRQFLAAGVDEPDLLEAAVALHQSKVEVVEEDGKMVARIDDGSIEDYVKVWSEGKGKAFITATSSGGGGKPKTPGGTDEYEVFFKPGTINLTKQVELKNVDPARYEALKQKHSQAQDTRLSVNQ